MRLFLALCLTTMFVAIVLFAGTPPATLTTLYDFTGQNGDGAQPMAGLIMDADGALYGTTLYGGSGVCNPPGFVQGCGTVFKLKPPAAGGSTWTETVLYSFAGPDNGDGAQPYGKLVLGKGGVLYGTAAFGGTGTCPAQAPLPAGCGIVFALNPPAHGAGWTEEILYNFTGQYPDGMNPYAGVTLGHGGEIYGTTLQGGRLGWGTVFHLTPPAAGETAWNERLLYSFKADLDGANPMAGVVIGTDGTLYGTTFSGGVNRAFSCGEAGCGSIYSLTQPKAGGGAWTETVLHRFGTNNGIEPHNLIFGSDGALYGTAQLGGTSPDKACGGGVGCGVVFRFAPPSSPGGSWTETVLRSFPSGKGDAAEPCGAGPAGAGCAVSIDSSGNIYGSSIYTGQIGRGGGAIFKLSPPAAGGTKWDETVLYRFDGKGSGNGDLGGVVISPTGVLYGAAYLDGANNAGSIFQLTLAP
jgi:uncharacterized protein YceK